MEIMDAHEIMFAFVAFYKPKVNVFYSKNIPTESESVEWSGKIKYNYRFL